MAPARNLLRRHHDGCGGCFFSGGNPDYSFNQEKTSAVVLSSPMAEEEEDVGCSTTSTTSKEEEGADHDPYKGWLQLGIAGHQPGDDPNNSTDLRTSSSSSRGRARSSELNLFPAERPPLPPMMMTSSSIFHNSVQPMITWGHRGPPPPPTTTGYSFSQVLGCPSSSSSGGGEFWVVSPPARPRTGVWFELKAAEIQGKQPFLPQIPKSYLRIKDGRMTVRLLMKYLANKLELGDESQVEISCGGQQLHPRLTLQHIRDNIWCAAPTVTMMMAPPLNLPMSTDHVMILNYGRRA